MSILDDLELALTLIVGLGIGGWLAGMGLRSQLRYLVLEILAQPKVTLAIQAATRLTQMGGKAKGLLGAFQSVAGPLLSQWAQAAQGAQEGAPGGGLTLFRPPPPPP